MYNAEVLSKFPVVQHFPFGSLFSWAQDPNAVPPPISMHTSNQPMRHDTGSGPTSRVPTQSTAQVGTEVPWTTAKVNLPDAPVGTQAPWAKRNRPSPPDAGIGAKGSLRRELETRGLNTEGISSNSGDSQNDTSSMLPPTKAPWAR